MLRAGSTLGGDLPRANDGLDAIAALFRVSSGVRPRTPLPRASQTGGGGALGLEEFGRTTL